MAYWNPQMYLDPLGAAIGQGINRGVGDLLQQRDQRVFTDWLGQQQQGAELMPLPKFYSNTFNQLGPAVAQAQLQNLIPLSPLEKAKLGLVRSQTGYYNAQTSAEQKVPAMAGQPQRLAHDNPYGLPAGTVVQFDRSGRDLLCNGRRGYGPPPRQNSRAKRATGAPAEKREVRR